MERIPVWLDCDTGQDDSIAILYAVQNPNLEVIGISTVYGNMSLDHTTQNTLNVLNIGDFNIDVYKGAKEPLLRKQEFAEDMHGDQGLGGCHLEKSKKEAISESVFQKIYEKLKSNKKKVYFIATACLTNLAILIKSFPDLSNYLEGISFLGGAEGIGNWQPQAEFNVYCDPEAAQIVFDSGLPIMQVPIETTHKYIVVKPEFIQKIENWGTQFSKDVSGIINFYRNGYVKVFGFENAILHDPAAVYAVAWKAKCQLEKVFVQVETKSKYCDGRTKIQRRPKQKNVDLVVQIDSEHFWNDLIENLYQIDQKIKNSQNLKK